MYSKQAVSNVRSQNWLSRDDGEVVVVEAPGGYKFYLHDKDVQGGES